MNSPSVVFPGLARKTSAGALHPLRIHSPIRLPLFARKEGRAHQAEGRRAQKGREFGILELYRQKIQGSEKFSWPPDSGNYHISGRVEPRRPRGMVERK